MSTTTIQTIDDLLEAYQLVRPLAKCSVKQHEYTLRTLETFLGRKPLMTDLEATTVNRWLMWLLEKPLSPISVSCKRRCLLALWRFAFEDRLTESQPVRIRKIQVRHATPVAWTSADLNGFLAMIEGMRGKRLHCHPQVVAADFWKAFVMVGYYTGLRLGDLLLLRFDQIEPTGWLGLIQHKTGYQIRGYLPPDAIEAIGAISEPKRARVFGDLMSKKCVQENYAKLVKRAGLKGSIKTLRKTAATMAECERPGAASWLLGHRDANIARRHYIDPTHVMQVAPQLPQLRIGKDGAI